GGLDEVDAVDPSADGATVGPVVAGSGGGAVCEGGVACDADAACGDAVCGVVGRAPGGRAAPGAGGSGGAAGGASVGVAVRGRNKYKAKPRLIVRPRYPLGSIALETFCTVVATASPPPAYPRIVPIPLISPCREIRAAPPARRRGAE